MASNINDNDVEMTYSDEYTVVSSTGTAGYNMLNKSNNNNKVTNHNNLLPPLFLLLLIVLPPCLIIF